MITFTDEQVDILDKAIEFYGVDNQLMKTIEELSELQQAVCKTNFDVTDDNIAHMVEEIADVLIMVQQLKMIFSLTDEEISAVKDFKIARLENTIKDK